jgi:hypothetical protein
MPYQQLSLTRPSDTSLVISKGQLKVLQICTRLCCNWFPLYCSYQLICTDGYGYSCLEVGKQQSVGPQHQPAAVQPQ